MNKRTRDLIRGLPIVLLVCGCAAPPWNNGQASRPVDAQQTIAAKTAAMGGWGAQKPGQANGVKSYAVANSSVDAGASRWGGRQAADGSLPVHASREQAVANAAKQLTGPAADTSQAATSDLDAMRRHVALSAPHSPPSRTAHSADARYQAALACWQKGDVSGAKFHLDQALSADSAHRDSILLFAEWCLLQDLADHAVPRLQRLCRTNPGDARACHTLGMLLSATGRESEALAFYQEAADLQPDDDLYQFTLNASQRENDATQEQVVDHRRNRSLADAEAGQPLRDDNVKQSYYGEDLESASISVDASLEARDDIEATVEPDAVPTPLATDTEGILASSPHLEPQHLPTAPTAMASSATAGSEEGVEFFQEISHMRDQAHQMAAPSQTSRKPRTCSVCNSHPAPSDESPAADSNLDELVGEPATTEPLRLQLGAGAASERQTSVTSDNDPNSAHGELLAQAQQAFDAGAIGKGVELLRQATAATADAPDREAAEIEVAVEALHRGQTALTLEILEPATRREIVTARVFRTLGTAYYRMGDYAAAQETLEQALSLDNTSALSYFLLGSTLHKLGKQREAATYLQRAAQLDPRFAERR